MISLVFYSIILLINLLAFKYSINFIYHNKYKFLFINITFLFLFIYFVNKGENDLFLIFEILFSYLLLIVFLVYKYIFKSPYLKYVAIFFLLSTFIFNYLNFFAISYLLAVPAFIMIFSLTLND